MQGGARLVAGVRGPGESGAVGDGGPQGAGAITAGTIGILSRFALTYVDFATNMLRLVRPEGTRVIWIQGSDTTAQFNYIADNMSGDWLWIMGDDHTFEATQLVQLLSLDLDVVVPLCLKKQAPFEPVVYGGEQVVEGKTYYTQAVLPATGVAEIHAAGSAGMLIRKRVLDELPRPVFETTGAQMDEDLVLCRKIRDAGFKLHCAVDIRLGHLGFFGVYPMWQGERFGTVLDLGNEQWTPLWAVDPEEEPA